MSTDTTGESVEELAAMLRVIADENRLRILKLLTHRGSSALSVKGGMQERV